MVFLEMARKTICLWKKKWESLEIVFVIVSIWA